MNRHRLAPSAPVPACAPKIPATRAVFAGSTMNPSPAREDR